MKMKIIIMVMMAVAISMVSCEHPRIDGDGRVVTEERAVNEFEDVFADGVFKVILKQGNNFEVNVETDRNLQDLVIIRTVNNRLCIELEEHANFDATKMNIHVSGPRFKHIVSDGVVNLISEGELEAETLRLENNGVGNVRLNVTCEDLDVELNGVGSITLEGETENLFVLNDGVGEIEAYGLIARYVNLKNSGVGKSEIFVTDELDVIISGVGNVFYKGNPEHTNSNITGVGKLKRR